MSRRRLILLGSVAVALAAALVVGVVLVWTRAESSRQARQLADRVAAGLAAGSPQAADYAASGLDPATEYGTITRGLRGSKPTVAVASVEESSDAAARVTLHFAWPIPGHDPWEYDTVAELRRTAKGWRAAWSPTLVAPGLTGDERLLYTRLAAARGEVLGADGARLAFNQPALRVGIDKTRLVPGGWDIAARTLADSLTKAGLPVDAGAYAAKVRAAGPQAFVEAALLRENLPAQAAIAQRVGSLAGVHTVRVTKALGLTSTFLRPILGQVGDATAEIVTASKGAIVAGDQVGTGGLQRDYDAILRGTPGYVIQAVPRKGAGARDYVRVTAVAGSAVRTTVDVKLQSAAERILAGVQPASAIVAIRPSDGEVLAVASGPGSAGVASTATQALYEPGSTFKTVTGLAMLRTGLSPTSVLSCPPSITVNGKRFDNDAGYPASALGRIPWTTAFAHSCNTAVIGQAGAVSQSDLAAAAADLGLTGGRSIGVPVTASRVPATASGAIDHAASMIGQGRVLVTPVGMAGVTASIAHGGLVHPVLVTSPTAAASPNPAGLTPVTGAEAKRLRTLMRGVVTDGTAASALAGTPGGPIIAKTGTSAYVVDGKRRWHTWLVAAQGDLAVAVLVADGSSGARTCGPLLKQFLTAVEAG